MTRVQSATTALSVVEVTVLNEGSVSATFAAPATLPAVLRMLERSP